MALTAAEQYELELINRARLDPEAEAARYGISLNDGLAPGTITTEAKQVLAPNADLEAAAQAHSEWMLATDTFSHQGAGGSDPGDRIKAEGYSTAGGWGYAENLATVFTTGKLDLEAAIEQHHKELFESEVHRLNTLHEEMREIGIAQVEGEFTYGGVSYNASMLTEKFAYAGSAVFVTGVAYDDADNDAFYGIGEGIGGIRFTAAGTSDTSDAAGGYSVAVAPTASVQVSVQQGSTALAALTMDMAAGNGKLDLVMGANNVWRLELSASATLISGVANATLLGVADLDLTGHGGANRLVGNKGDNRLSGNAGNDTLIGGAGNDRFFDGSGSDVMTGGAGADVFVLALDGVKDTITDFTQGVDRIDLSAWTTLTSIAQLVMTATSNGLRISYGNEVVEIASSDGQPISPTSLTADDLVNIAADLSSYTPIYGTPDDDTLIGGDGSDILYGGDGADRLDGGAGADALEGGLGNDRYVIDHSGDVIQNETGYSQGGGIDTVESWISFTLPQSIEILRLQGTANLNGTGRGAPEALVGNTGNNMLDGGGGKDQLNGKDGNDTLIGGEGLDWLVGEAGEDVFLYRSTAESGVGQENRDLINGFEHGEDTIDLSAIDASTLASGNQAFDFIGTTGFSGKGSASAGELRAYNWNNGNFVLIETDVNGDGRADMQIYVMGTDSMSASDFIL